MSWRSMKQTLIATSTMEVEFVSCFEATSNGVWLKSFIFGMRVVVPLRFYCDNLAAVFGMRVIFGMRVVDSIEIIL